jgi:hypothetical protein
MSEYRIGKQQESCTACGREFQDAQEVVSCVFQDADSLGRADLCLECWEAGRAPAHFSNWRRRVERKTPPKVFNRKAALDLFRVLADSEEPRDADTAYILALLLMRKKALDLARAGTVDGANVMVLKAQGSSEEFRVTGRDLTEERLEEVKNNLESIFEDTRDADGSPQ